MTAGRKPKPTALKLVTGNPGKRAVPKKEARIPPARPLPPPFLSDDAKVEWGRVVDKLFNVGMMTELDYGALAAYCQAFGRWSQAERALARMSEKDPTNYAFMVKTTSGNAIQNPLVGTANKAMADMVRFAAEFGMTPSARTRVEPVFPVEPNAPKQANGVDEFFGR